MLKAIGFEFENSVEIVFGKDFVIHRAIIGRVSIRIRARLFQDFVAFLAGVMFAAAKHQVLEQMRIAALAFFGLIARTGLHHDVKGDEVRIVSRHRDQPQAVRQIVDRVIVSERLARLLG